MNELQSVNVRAREKEGVQSFNRHNGLGTKKRSFSLAEKLEFLKILEQALLDNPKGAFTRVATKHNISKRNLSRWRKDTSLNKVILTQDNMLKRKFTTGRGVDKEKEQFVVDYVLSRRERKLPVNGNIIALAMKNKYNDLADLTVKQVRVKAYRVLDRNNFSNRRITNNKTILDEQEQID